VSRPSGSRRVSPEGDSRACLRIASADSSRSGCTSQNFAAGLVGFAN
jgi:hypothetical protein